MQMIGDRERIGELEAENARLQSALAAFQEEKRSDGSEDSHWPAEIYTSLANNVRDVIWMTDLTMAYTYISPSVEWLRGYTPEEVMTQGAKASLAPGSYEIVAGALAEALAGEAAGKQTTFVRLEYEMKRKDGSTVWVESVIGFIRDVHGKPTHLVGVTRDISERREAREDLEKWAQVFENASWGIEVSSGDGKRLEMVNPAYASMHGYEVDELIGFPTKDMFPKNVQASVEIYFEEVVALGHKIFETEHQRKDGTTFPVLVNATAVKDDAGEVLYCAVHVQDITRQKETEKAYHEASRMEATATLAGGVAHDFNNLMVAVLGNASLIRMSLGEEHACLENLMQIEQAAERAGVLSQQMLAFARGGKHEPRVMSVNVALAELLDLHDHSFSPDLIFERDFGEELWNVQADPSQFAQVVLNLCINASEATEGAGKVIVRTCNENVSEDEASRFTGMKPGRYVKLTIEDSGHGMDEETKAHAFEPFYTTKKQGRGLGLAAVYGIVKNHHGFVYFETTKDQGCCFFVYLPATERALKRKGPLRRGVRNGNGKETVLIIDDEDLVVTATRQLLERFGYKVLIAVNGREGVDLAREYDGEIHAALLDLGMPVMSGAEAFPLLHEARPDMKVIICSGFDLDSSSQELLDNGATSFLHKPFRAEELNQTIQSALTQSA